MLNSNYYEESHISKCRNKICLFDTYFKKSLQFLRIARIAIFFIDFSLSYKQGTSSPLHMPVYGIYRDLCCGAIELAICTDVVSVRRAIEKCVELGHSATPTTHNQRNRQQQYYRWNFPHIKLTKYRTDSTVAHINNDEKINSITRPISFILNQPHSKNKIQQRIYEMWDLVIDHRTPHLPARHTMKFVVNTLFGLLELWLLYDYDSIIAVCVIDSLL